MQRQTKVKKDKVFNIYHVTAHGLTADGLGRVGTSTCTLHTLAPATQRGVCRELRCGQPLNAYCKGLE